MRSTNNPQSKVEATLRAALMQECAGEFRPWFEMLIEITRVYAHALGCSQCVCHAAPIGGVFAAVARHVGEIVCGWQVLGIPMQDVLRPQSPELSALLDACIVANEVASGAQLEHEWRIALGTAGLGVAERSGQEMVGHIE
jgi:hypothetical protein